MTLPKELTTVTSFSKILAAVLFILFPFIGFFLGMQYQAVIDQTKQSSAVPAKIVVRIPTITPIPSSAEIVNNSKTYNDGKILFHYPDKYIVGGTKEYLFVGKTGGPNGSCTPGGVGIDLGGVWYKNYKDAEQYIRNDLDNVQIETINGGHLFTGITKPGQCGDNLRTIAVFAQGKDSSIIAISLDGNNPEEMSAFKQITSTFRFIQ